MPGLDGHRRQPHQRLVRSDGRARRRPPRRPADGADGRRRRVRSVARHRLPGPQPGRPPAADLPDGDPPAGADRQRPDLAHRRDGLPRRPPLHLRDGAGRQPRRRRHSGHRRPRRRPRQRQPPHLRPVAQADRGPGQPPHRAGPAHGPLQGGGDRSPRRRRRQRQLHPAVARGLRRDNLYADHAGFALALEAEIARHASEGVVVDDKVGYRRVRSGIEKMLVAYQSRKGG